MKFNGFFKSRSDPSVRNSETGSAPSNDEYDPHIHRNVSHPTTNFETLVHILKGSLGTGILAMPQAYSNSGYILGMVGTILIGTLCAYCLRVLVRSQYILCKRHRVPFMTFSESMKMALQEGPECLQKFADASGKMVTGTMIVYQMGICCVYIVFVGSSMKQLLDVYWIELDIKIHMLIVLFPLIALNLIRNLKLLAPFSTVANIITFVGLGLVIAYIVDGMSGFSERDAFVGIGTYPLFFGTAIFAIEAVGVVIAVETKMKSPKSFGLVLSIAMSIIVALYASVGLLGYLKCGDQCEGSITLYFPKEEIMAQSITVIFAVAVFISYSLQCYVPVEIIWNTFLVKRLEGSEHILLWEYVMRMVIVIITFLFAVAIPRLGLFISLFGALCLSAVGLIFPAIIEMCVLWPENPGKSVFFKDALLIIFGFVGLISGTYTSIRDIILSFM